MVRPAAVSSAAACQLSCKCLMSARLWSCPGNKHMEVFAVAGQRCMWTWYNDHAQMSKKQKDGGMSWMLAIPNVTDQLQSVSSVVKCRLRCHVSTTCKSVSYLQSVCSVMICHLGCSPSAQLCYISSAAVCWVSHDLSAWLQSVSSPCELSCNVSAQFHSKVSVWISCNQCVDSAAICQLSCDMSAQSKCNVSSHQQPVGWAAMC